MGDGERQAQNHIEEGDATNTSRVLRIGVIETIATRQKEGRKRIIELIEEARAHAANGDMNNAFDTFEVADIIAQDTGDTVAREAIATGTNLLYSISIRTK